MSVNKILGSDLREAVLVMDNLFGSTFVELLAENLEKVGVLSERKDDSRIYTVAEINKVLTAIFGKATPLVMGELEKHLQAERI